MISFIKILLLVNLIIEIETIIIESPLNGEGNFKKK
jgi:hypothetical protein